MRINMDKNIEFIDFYMKLLDHKFSEEVGSNEEKAVNMLNFNKYNAKGSAMMEILCEYVDKVIENELSDCAVNKIWCESVEPVDDKISIVLRFNDLSSHDKLRGKVNSIIESLPDSIGERIDLFIGYNFNKKNAQLV